MQHPTLVFDIHHYLMLGATYLIDRLSYETRFGYIVDFIDIAIKESMCKEPIFVTNDLCNISRNYYRGTLAVHLEQPNVASVIRDPDGLDLVITGIVDYIKPYLITQHVYELTLKTKTYELYAKDLGNIYELRYKECVEQHQYNLAVKEEWNNYV